ncbi:hypothetical protein MA16_Dca028601 [Dendrobium catenatum]|uniref:Uncharacterized protein n=1 Tax=Dendrobium catenatum TaxID=906689 RepID=A0A2I0V8T0_9ASPA|nr:hypothetical protein MA16_Dca028601 [Dendrobium catenatum]
MGPSMIMLVQRCGPCSPLACEDKLSPEDIFHQILKRDQARIDYIHKLRKLATNSSSFNPLGRSLSATVPAKDVFVGS